MHISIDEFWSMTPRFFYGLMKEYINQKKGKPERKEFEYIDDSPTFAAMMGR